MTRLTRALLGAAIFLAPALASAQAPPVVKPPPPAEKGKVNIRWLGQSMFELVTPKGTSIYFDPHNLEAYRIKAASLKADLVLMSHFHTDHTSMEPFSNAKALTDGRAVFNGLKKVDERRNLWNEVDKDFKDVHIKVVGSYHDTQRGLTRGLNAMWMVDVAGLRIVHAGDLGHLLNPGQLKALGKVDVLMVPVGGVYALNGIDAQRVVDQVKPRRWVLPMHYGTVVYDDLLVLKYFLDEQEDTPIEKFKPRQWLTIDPKSPAPKKHSVGVLHYEW